jgi:hypothetical protein
MLLRRRFDNAKPGDARKVVLLDRTSTNLNLGYLAMPSVRLRAAGRKFNPPKEKQESGSGQ